MFRNQYLQFCTVSVGLCLLIEISVVPSVFGLRNNGESCWESIPSTPSSFSESGINGTQTTPEGIISSDGECDYNKDLVCIDGNCQCRQTLTPYSSKNPVLGLITRFFLEYRIYDRENDRCVVQQTLPLGHEGLFHLYHSTTCLNRSADCPTPTECFTYRKRFFDLRAPHFYFCRCRAPLVLDRVTNFCRKRKGYGETCSSSDQCQVLPWYSMLRNTDMDYYGYDDDGPFLRNGVCLNSKCTCPPSSLTIYDPKSKSCASLPGGDCMFSKYKCLGGSECSNYTYSSFPPTCKCQELDELSTDGTMCLGGHFKRCGPERICNAGQGLICINGQCQCKSPKYEVYGSRLGIRRCLARVGSPCSNLEGNSNLSNCVPSSTCLEGKCECGPGLTPSSNKLGCYRNYGESCLEIKYSPPAWNFTCDPHRRFICGVNGTCVCDSTFVIFNHRKPSPTYVFYKYDRNTRMCEFPSRNPNPNATTLLLEEEALANVSLSLSEKVQQENLDTSASRGASFNFKSMSPFMSTIGIFSSVYVFVALKSVCNVSDTG